MALRGFPNDRGIHPSAQRTIEVRATDGDGGYRRIVATDIQTRGKPSMSPISSGGPAAVVWVESVTVTGWLLERC